MLQLGLNMTFVAAFDEVESWPVTFVNEKYQPSIQSNFISPANLLQRLQMMIENCLMKSNFSFISLVSALGELLLTM